jgi:hypothetical protein
MYDEFKTRPYFQSKATNKITYHIYLEYPVHPAHPNYHEYHLHPIYHGNPIISINPIPVPR